MNSNNVLRTLPVHNREGIFIGTKIIMPKSIDENFNWNLVIEYLSGDLYVDCGQIEKINSPGLRRLLTDSPYKGKHVELYNITAALADHIAALPALREHCNIVTMLVPMRCNLGHEVTKLFDLNRSSPDIFLRTHETLQCWACKGKMEIESGMSEHAYLDHFYRMRNKDLDLRNG